MKGVLALHTARLVAAGTLRMVRSEDVAIRMESKLPRAVARIPRQLHTPSQLCKFLKDLKYIDTDFVVQSNVSAYEARHCV